MDTQVMWARIKQKKRLVIAGGIVACAFVGVGSMAYWLSQPAVVTEVQAVSTTEPSGTNPTSNEIESAYFSTRVNAQLVPRALQPPPKTVLERHRLVSKPPEGDQLAITVIPLPAGGLTESPDIVLRKRNPNTYTAENADYLPPGSMVYVSDGDTFEQAAFLVHNGIYAAVVVSGRSDREPQLRGALQEALLAWHWK